MVLGKKIYRRKFFPLVNLKWRNKEHFLDTAATYSIFSETETFTNAKIQKTTQAKAKKFENT